MVDDAQIEQARCYSLLKLLPAHKTLKKHNRGYMTNCEFHEDTTPSMSLVKYEDGHWRYRCFGCGVSGDPITYLQLTKGVTFMDAVEMLSDKAREAPPKPRIVATYDYFDEDGVLLYQAVRKEPKAFSARRPSPDYDENGRKWIWDLCGVRRVLYRLPKLLSLPREATVYYVEGEKDVETLERNGLFATTHAGGAGAFRDELIAPLTKRRIVVIPDRDDPGMQLGRRVWAAGRKYGCNMGFVLLSRGKDVTEFLCDNNGTVEELVQETK